jgi:hypothetical protein
MVLREGPCPPAGAPEAVVCTTATEGPTGVWNGGSRRRPAVLTEPDGPDAIRDRPHEPIDQRSHGQPAQLTAVAVDRRVGAAHRAHGRRGRLVSGRASATRGRSRRSWTQSTRSSPTAGCVRRRDPRTSTGSRRQGGRHHRDDRRRRIARPAPPRHDGPPGHGLTVATTTHCRRAGSDRVMHAQWARAEG